MYVCHRSSYWQSVVLCWDKILNMIYITIRSWLLPKIFYILGIQILKFFLSPIFLTSIIPTLCPIIHGTLLKQKLFSISSCKFMPIPISFYWLAGWGRNSMQCTACYKNYVRTCVYIYEGNGLRHHHYHYAPPEWREVKEGHFYPWNFLFPPACCCKVAPILWTTLGVVST